MILGKNLGFLTRNLFLRIYEFVFGSLGALKHRYSVELSNFKQIIGNIVGILE